jgi:hypothetical protein
MMTNNAKQAAFLALQQGLAHFSGRPARLLNVAEALDTDELRVLYQLTEKLARRLQDEGDEELRAEALKLSDELERARHAARGWLPATLEFDELHRRLEKVHRDAEYVVTAGSPELGRCRRHLLEHLINARAEAHSGALELKRRETL